MSFRAKKGIYEDGQVYLPVDWDGYSYKNQRFYWDDGEKLLVYALPEEIVCMQTHLQKVMAGPLLKKKTGSVSGFRACENYTDIREESFAASEDQMCIYWILTGIHETAALRHKTSVRVKGGIHSRDY